MDHEVERPGEARDQLGILRVFFDQRQGKSDTPQYRVGKGCQVGADQSTVEHIVRLFAATQPIDEKLSRHLGFGTQAIEGGKGGSRVALDDLLQERVSASLAIGDDPGPDGDQHHGERGEGPQSPGLPALAESPSSTRIPPPAVGISPQQDPAVGVYAFELLFGESRRLGDVAGVVELALQHDETA